MKCLHCLNCPKFGQLIFWKIIRIVATRCQIFGGKNVQNSISAGALPQTPFGELTALPLTPWLHLRGLLLRGGEGRGGNVNEREKEDRNKEFAPSPILTTDRRPCTYCLTTELYDILVYWQNAIPICITSLTNFVVTIDWAWFYVCANTRGYRGGSPTAVRPSDPAL